MEIYFDYPKKNDLQKKMNRKEQEEEEEESRKGK